MDITWEELKSIIYRKQITMMNATTIVQGINRELNLYTSPIWISLKIARINKRNIIDTKG